MWKLVFVFVITVDWAYANKCTIAINGGLNDRHPLILWPNSEKFVEPEDTSGIININQGTSIEFSGALATCTSTGNFFINDDSWKELIKHGHVCPKHPPVSSHGVEVFTKEIVLKSFPSHTVHRTTRKCHKGASILEIGFQLCQRFISIMELCHDEIRGSTLYARYNLNPANIAFQKNVDRPAFVTQGFYKGQNIENLYKRKTQQETFTKILGSRALALDLVKATGTSYLVRGHLAAKADFIYGVQQRATFYYVNVAPQWQQINLGNWVIIENGVRKLVADKKVSYEIYSGTYGVMTTADVKNVQRELFLNANGNHRLIPVPKYFYRIVIEQNTGNGFALITVNNPYLNIAEIQKSYILCRDISYQMTWLKWDRKNIKKGYSYACSVADFYKAIQN